MHDASAIPFWFPIIGSALGLLSLWLAYRAGRKQRLIDDLPTSKTTGIFIGLVELKGRAESARPLVSHLARERCVQYEWTVEEHWARTVTESYTDSQGRRRTRTRRESGWREVDRGGALIPFYLRDDLGAVLVRPEGAKLDPVELFSRTCGRSDPLYYDKGPRSSILNSTHRRRFRETGLPAGVELYVVGQARERSDVVAPEIAADSRAPLFLISTRSEKQVSRSYRWALRGWLFFGAAAVAGGFVLRDLAFGLAAEDHWPRYLLAFMGYVAAGTAGWVWMVYNSLIELRQRVRQAWSLVDVQLKRRHDLIPNLVQIVTGLRDHERKVQVEVTDLRSQLEATPPGEPGPDFHGCAQDVRIIREAYPELQSDGAFSNLQQNLIETEQRIALARAYFNDIATFYNTRIAVVPDRCIAYLAGCKPKPLLAAEDFERAPVAVEFSESAALQDRTG